MFDSPDQLVKKIQLGEDSFLEMKELLFAGIRIKGPSRSEFAAEIAGFANARGGTLVLGVNDKSREVTGIPIDRLDLAEQFVVEVCHDLIDPPVDPDIERIQIPDTSGQLRAIIRISIERSLSVHSTPFGYFRRVGSARREMTQDQFVRLIRERSQSRLIRFDESAIPRSSTEDLVPTLVDRFRTVRVSEDRIAFSAKLAMVVRDDLDVMRMTIAGALLGTSAPERWLPHAYIQAVAYRGRTIVDALDERNYQRDKEDICGPIDAQVAQACRFVASNQQVSRGKKIGSVDYPQYDMSAIFEAIVNAVAHRDYSLHQSKIRLRMFSDRLEIYTPGELVSTMTAETLPYRQATRNETITSLLARCAVPVSIPGLETSRSTLMDRRGEGVPIILEKSERLSGRLPTYEVFDDSELRLTIFGANGDCLES